MEKSENFEQRLKANTLKRDILSKTTDKIKFFKEIKNNIGEDYEKFDDLLEIIDNCFNLSINFYDQKEKIEKILHEYIIKIEKDKIDKYSKYFGIMINF